MVGHSREEWAYRDRVTGILITPNHAEVYFSIVKRGMIGIYQHRIKHHLRRYLAQFDLQYSRTESKLDTMTRSASLARLKALTARGSLTKRLGQG